ncbi:hypothetical protein FNF27_00043 [Cafeteria roenbergensis]|uniref:SF3 helicase domain-containing protein n=1 Tax=Cafeteria roenbergensis TaxID=33653 RepID=A0A5A8EKM9_CAFRO|nr:hypothetical protein FNF27_00043 [Cafeteria roenbergensis]
MATAFKTLTDAQLFMASNPDKTFLTQSMGDWKYRVFDSPDDVDGDAHLTEYIVENSPRRFYVDFEDYFEPGTFSPEDIARLNETDGKTTAGKLQIFQQFPTLHGGYCELRDALQAETDMPFGIMPYIGVNIRDYAKGKNKKPMQKVSVHIIFYGMYFKDHASMEVFAKRTVQSKEFQEKYPANEPGEGFDTAVYSKNQGLRMFGQTKSKRDPHSAFQVIPRIETIVKQEFPYAGLVIPRGRDLDNEKEVVCEPAPVKKSRTATTSTGSLGLLEGLLNLLPDTYCVKYDQWFRIGCICASVSDGSDEGLAIWANKSRQAKGYERTEDDVYAKKWATIKPGEVNLGTLYKILSSCRVKKEAIRAVTLQHCGNHLSLGTEFHNMVEEWNDHNIAMCFKAHCKTQFKFSLASGWWRLTDNNTWHNDGMAPHFIRTALLETLHPMFEQAIIEAKKDNNSELATILKAHRRNLGNNKMIKGIYEFLSEYLADLDIDAKIDANPNLTAFDDCLYDCEADAFRPITADDYISTTCGYAFGEYKHSEETRAELLELLGGILGSSLDYFLLTQSAALCATKFMSDFYIWVGNGGNGKGVINEFLMLVFGKSGAPAPPGLFHKVLDSKNPELLKLRNKRYVSIPDSEPERDGTASRLGGLVKLLDGDEILVRDNYARSTDMVSMKATFVFNILCNDVPEVGTDGGIQRRMKVIPFPYKFVDEPTLPHEKPKDPTLKRRLSDNDKYKKEMFILLAEKYQELVSKRYTVAVPESVMTATRDVEEENNPVKTWFLAKYDITGDDAHRASIRDLHDAYVVDTGDRRTTNRQLSKVLCDMMLRKKKTKTCNVFVGIREKPAEPEMFGAGGTLH